MLSESTNVAAAAKGANDRMLAESRQALQRVRRAFIELYASLGIDPSSPQQVAKQLQLNRNLTWKLSKVVGANDPFAMLNHLPGEQGVELATEAFRRAGAPDSIVAEVRSVTRDFHQIVELHAGDRDHFELTLESMGLFEREQRLDSSRVLAFRGNSAIWGVQARTRLATLFIAPMPDRSELSEYVQLGSYVGFRRLRPDARWRLFRVQIHDDRGNLMPQSVGPEPILPVAPGDPPMLLREFCSRNMPQIESIDRGGEREFILTGGSLGNLGAFDCTFGYIARGLNAFRSESDSWASVATGITLPINTLVFDIIYHRERPVPRQPEVLVYGFPHGGLDSPAAQTVQNQLPISGEFTELADSPPAVATPLVPWYGQAVGRVYARMGWNPKDFLGMRMQMPYPPMSTRVVVRWPLPEQP